MPHLISFEELLDYVEGRQDAAEVQRIEAHLAEGCPDCETDLAWLRRTLDLMATDQTVSAPPELVQRAQRLYKPPQRRPQGPRAALWAPLQALWAQLWTSRQARYVAAVSATCLLVLGSWWAWGNTTVAQAATLSQVSGPVFVLLPGATEWQPGTEGMTLAAGSTLRSGDGGAACLIYPDGSHTEIAARSQVEIVSLMGQRNRGATTVRLNQVEGHSEHELTRGKSTVEVNAPGAVAEGRKGNYEIEVRNSAVEIQARRGNVDVHVGTTTTHLSAGERGLVEGGEVRVEPSDRSPMRSGEPPAPSVLEDAENGNQPPGQSVRSQNKDKQTPPGQAAKDGEKTKDNKGSSPPAARGQGAGEGVGQPGKKGEAPGQEKPR